MGAAVKVLYLTHSLSDVDGVGRYGTEVVRRLLPRLDGARVLIGRKHRGVSERFPASVPVRVALPPDYWLYLSWPKFLAYLSWSAPRVAAAAAGADLIHALSDYPHALLAVAAGRLLGRPVVVSGHGTYSVAPWRYRGHRRLVRWAYGRADALLLGSRFAKSRLDECHGFAQARVVPYGVDPAAFAEAPRLPPPPGAPRRYVLTIGELKERKGHHLSIPGFLEAARRHPEVHLVVVGRFLEGDPYFEARRREVRAAGMEDRVHFVGLVSEEEKLRWIGHAEVFLLTPVTSAEGGFEAFGLVFLEANAAGVPTVGMRGSGAVDAIRHEETGLLAAEGDAGDVARCLDRLLGDRALRERLGRAGRAFAGENTWERTAEGVMAVYREVLGGGGG